MVVSYTIGFTSDLVLCLLLLSLFSLCVCFFLFVVILYFLLLFFHSSPCYKGLSYFYVANFFKSLRRIKKVLYLALFSVIHLLPLFICVINSFSLSTMLNSLAHVWVYLCYTTGKKLLF